MQGTLEFILNTPFAELLLNAANDGHYTSDVLVKDIASLHTPKGNQTAIEPVVDWLWLFQNNRYLSYATVRYVVNDWR